MHSSRWLYPLGLAAIVVMLPGLVRAQMLSGDPVPATDMALPRIEVTSAKDRPALCITIETLMAFATRLKAHIARCPDSARAASTAKWEKARVDYSKQYTQNRCRRTLPN